MVLDIEGAGVFRIMSTRTIEADIYLTNLLRAAGAELALTEALRANEAPDSRIFRAVSGSGKLFDILAGALVPEDVDSLAWTPEIARETAAKLKRVTSDNGKRALTLAVVPLVTGFFLNGLHSLVTSPNSSAEAAKGARPASVNVVTLISGTGPSWFASLRAGIRNARKRLSHGR